MNRAFEIVRDNGGFLTFKDFDRLMLPEEYIIAGGFLIGAELPYIVRKANNDKLCAFKACRDGLLEQTRTGYRVKAANSTQLPSHCN